MDPVGIVSLVATSVGLASRAVSTAQELDEFITNYRSADKSVSKLAHQLRVFAVTVDQLDELLDANAIVSDNLKGAITFALQDCDDVLKELEEHIHKVVSRNDGAKGLSFTGKMKLLWSQGAVAKEEERLHAQLQTLLLLTGFVRK